VLTPTATCEAVRSLLVVALLIGSASAASAQLKTVDACQVLGSRYCLPPATDAGDALAQLTTLEKNPLVEHPIEFSTVYRSLFTQFINSQISSLALGSSLAAFAFDRDPATGALRAKSTTFGPLLSDRPQTAGRGAFSFAITTQRMRFAKLDGLDLDTDGLTSDYDYSTGSPPSVDSRSQRYTSRLHLDSLATVFAGAYGVSDRLDVYVSVPFVRTTLDGTTAYDYSSLVGPADTLQTAITGTSSGIGDVSIRGKFAIGRGDRVQLAVLGEERLPTGDPDKLLGLGKALTKILLLGSASTGRVSPHWTAGYSWVGKGVDLGELRLTGKDLETYRIVGTTVVEPSNEFNYSAGLEAATGSRVTLAGEIVGRLLRNSVELATVRQFSRVHYARTVTFFEESNAVNIVIGAVGAKWNFADKWLLVANVLFPVTQAGLQLGVTPVLSVQKAIVAGR